MNKKFSIWHLFPFTFGLGSLIAIWLFISSLFIYYDFRYKNPLNTIGVVTSVDTSEAIYVSVTIINPRNQKLVVKNKIGNEIEGMKIDDKIDVLYFNKFMDDAVLNTYWNIEGVVIVSFILMIGFIFTTIILIMIFYSKNFPKWLTYLININPE